MATEDTDWTRPITEAWISSHRLAANAKRERWWDNALPGFGVVIGARSRTFIARGRVDGIDKETGKPKTIRRDIKIGVWGQPGAGDDHGDLWTEPRARKKARSLLGLIDADIDPLAERAATSDSYTLRKGVEAHLKRMRDKERAERTIQTFEHETGKYLGPYLDTPINDLDVEAIVEAVRARVKPRRGSVNKKGAMVARRVIAHISAAWRSLNKKEKGKLGNWNPAGAVDKPKYVASGKRVEDLSAWAAVVATIHSPIRRDGLHLALYTGLRHEDVRSIRFEHVNFDEHTLELPDPKGGPDKAFTIPISKTALEILERRQRDNARDLGDRDPEGWAFPAINHGGEVGPITNLRQQGEHNGPRVPTEDVHTLRRTYLSIAHEEGVAEIDQKILSNHSFAGQDVHRSYVRAHLDHLAKCAAKIDAGITRRLKGETDRNRQTARKRRA